MVYIEFVKQVLRMQTAHTSKQRTQGVRDAILSSLMWHAHLVVLKVFGLVPQLIGAGAASARSLMQALLHECILVQQLRLVKVFAEAGRMLFEAREQLGLELREHLLRLEEQATQLEALQAERAPSNLWLWLRPFPLTLTLL